MEEEAPPSVKLTSLNNDWKIIKCFNWTGVSLGAAPPFDFQRQKFENMRLYQYYTAVLTTLTLFGSIHAFVGRHFMVYRYMNLTTITMDVLSLTAWLIFILSVIISSGLSSDLTEQLLGSLVKNDLFLHPKQKDDADRQQELKFRITASFFHITFFLLIIYDSYVWLSVFSFHSLNYYFFKNFQYYIPIFVTLHFCEILKFIKSRFTFSTNILIDLVDKIHKFPDDNSESAEDGVKINQWIRVTQKIKPRQEDIMQLKLISKIFGVLFDSVQLFNKIFEWQLLFFIFATMIEVLQAINFMIAYGSGAVFEANFANVYFIILRLLWAMLFMGVTGFLVKHCVDFKGTMRGLALYINKRLLEMPADELLRDEAQETLIVINQQFMHRPLAISTLFFYLDYEFIANTILTITSFSPVIIQFNRI